MTALIVFGVLLAACIAFTIDDNYRSEAARQVDEFYRVEDTCVLREGLTADGRF